MELGVRRKIYMLFRAIEAVTGMNEREVISKSRRRNVTTTRKLFSLVARNNLKLKWIEIAEALRRDHSTVMVAERGGRALAEYDEAFIDRYMAILSQLKNQNLVGKWAGMVTRFEKMEEQIAMLIERVHYLERLNEVRGSKIKILEGYGD